MHRIFFPMLALLLAAGISAAQTISPDSLERRFSAIEKDISLLKNLKITGYVQAQWQRADTTGAKIFGGGGLAPLSNNKFSIRRGRLRFQYSQKNFTLVVQPDFTERGIIIRDFFATVTEPWTGHFSLSIGQFFRPVSFEVLNPSWQRESPDRARFCQTLFADERDVGAMLTFKKGPLKFDLALVNGNAMAAESDSRKDVIGRVSFVKKWTGGQFSTAASTYQGSVRQQTKFAYRTDSDRAGFVLKDTATALGRFAKRQYFGWDVQFSKNWRPGTTTFRLELVGGTQPGTFSSSESQKTKDGLAGDIFVRPTFGGAAYMVQNLGKSHFQAVVKYDFFDGNTNTAGDEIGLSQTRTGAADLRYDTWGLGLNFYWKNLMATAYFDMIKNEASANLPGFKKDIKDNFLTLRGQIRF